MFTWVSQKRADGKYGKADIVYFYPADDIGNSADQQKSDRAGQEI
jgi:hypothetical protein